MALVLVTLGRAGFHGNGTLVLLLLACLWLPCAVSSWKVKTSLGSFGGKYSQHLCAVDSGFGQHLHRHTRSAASIRQTESKWQHFWEHEGVFRARESFDSAGSRADVPAAGTVEAPLCEENCEIKHPGQLRKFYGLCMIPYPSGDGLHVGHLLGYTVLDVICRYKRMNGYQVLHPIGWDSFGLPAERYAESVNADVRQVTRDNIENFKRQLKCMGFSYDWSREVQTSDPSYYRWTQWIFQQFYKHGIAYRAKEMVNWCPELNSVLANEEVKGGRSERGGYPVYRKQMDQWLLRITDYAQRLSDDLDKMDWPEPIVSAQKKWIGLAQGYKVTFSCVDNVGPGFDLYGFITDPAELRDIDRIEVSTDMANLCDFVDPALKKEVAQLIDDTAKMSNLERYDNKRLLDSGRKVLNPVTGTPIKVYVTNTQIPFSRPINCYIVTDPRASNSNLCASTGTDRRFEVDVSGVNTDSNGTHPDVIVPFVNVKLKDWIFSRQRSWGEPIPLHHDGDNYTLVDESMLPVETGSVHMETMPQWAGSSWHFLRFCDPANVKEAFAHSAAKFWMPVDLYVGGAEHAISHLLYARFWNKCLYDMGISPVSEPFKRILLHGMIHNASFSLDGKPLDPQLVVKHKGQYVLKSDMTTAVNVKLEKMSKSKGNVVSPDPLIDRYGADALRLHLLFLGPVDKHKIWSDAGLVGVSRLLTRIDEFFRGVKIVSKKQVVDDRLRLLVSRITHDIEKNLLNVAVSDFFSYLPFLLKSSVSGRLGRNVANTFLKLLSPFAPHMAEELWHLVNPECAGSISNEPWPVAADVV